MGKHCKVSEENPGPFSPCRGPQYCYACREDLRTSIPDTSIQSSRAHLVQEIATLGKEKERLEREISDTRAAASIHAEEHRKLRAQLQAKDAQGEALVSSAKEMVEAYEPSYENKWQAESIRGVSHRMSWREDERVLQNLKNALKSFGNAHDDKL